MIESIFFFSLKLVYKQFLSSSKSVIRTKNTEIRENFDDKNPLDEPIKGQEINFLNDSNFRLCFFFRK